jgi:hypothetical protein
MRFEDSVIEALPSWQGASGSYSTRVCIVIRFITVSRPERGRLQFDHPVGYTQQPRIAVPPIPCVGNRLEVRGKRENVG